MDYFKTKFENCYFMFTHDTQDIATESGYWSICSIKIALCINMCINNGYFLTDLASSSSFRK